MTLDRPRVSIIITSYNYECFLGEAIESALGQSFESMEVIVVDDGSSDNSLTVVGSYPVRVIRQANAGVGAARNHGAAEAQGEYLVFLDADDRLAFDYVERCVFALDGAPPSVAYAFTAMELFGAERGRVDPPSFDSKKLLLGNTVHASAMIRRKSFEQIGGFDVRWRLAYEDYELWIRLLSRGLTGIKVDGTVLSYRRHGITRNTLDQQQLAFVQRALMRTYPQLFWRQIVRKPARFVLDSVCDALAGRSVQIPVRPFPRAQGPVTLSVILVNWNSRQDLTACLRSLEAQTDQDFEVIVVDNGSEDGSVEMVRKEFPWVVLLATEQNLGFAEGCNRGIQAATGAWIATLNNDAEADPRWISELRRAMREGDDRLGMLQSRILFRHRPDRTNSTGVMLFANAVAIDRGFDAPFVENESEEEIFCPSAGAAVYRRVMLDDVCLSTGFFDRSFFMYFEDVDLGWRSRLAGWKARYIPTAVVHHAFHSSANRKNRHFVEIHCQRNRLRMLLKNGSPWFVARGFPRTIIHMIWSLKVFGPGILRGFATAFHEGRRLRSEVSSLIRVARGDIEHRWVTKRRP